VSRLQTVSRAEYVDALRRLGDRVVDTPISTESLYNPHSMSVMQTTLDGTLVAQAIYVRGLTPRYELEVA